MKEINEQIEQGSLRKKESVMKNEIENPLIKQ